MTLPDSTLSARYTLAVALVAAAVGARLALDPLLGSSEPLLVFMLAILAAVRFGGRGPGLAATALSVLGAWFFFIEPRYSFAIAQASDRAGLLLMAACGVGVSLFPRASKPKADVSAVSEATPSYRWRAIMLGSALVSLLLLTGLLYKDFQREQDAQSWVAHTYQILNRSGSLLALLEESESDERGYVLTGDRRFLESLQSAMRAADSARQSLRQLTADNPRQQSQLDLLDRLAETRFAILRKVVQIRDTAGLKEAVGAIRAGNGRQMMLQLTAAVQAIQTEERTLLAQREAQALDRSLGTRWLLGLGSGLLLLLLVFAGAVIEREIRERERARRVIRQSEERLRLALDSANAGAWEWDLRTGRNVWSEEVWNLYGLDPRTCQPSYEAWRTAIHPEDRAKAEEVVAEAARTGGELNVEFRVGSDAGPSRWLLARARAMPDARGRIERFTGIVLDITERKQAEEALRERERNLRRFTEAAPVAIAMFDLEMRYLAASERFRDDFHLGPAELTGRSHYDVFPEISDAWREVHRRCLAGAAEQSDGERFVRADGEEQWIRWAIQPWRRADGGIGGIVLFSEEITPQKRSEQALRQSEAQFRTLANAIPQLCWMANADGGIFWYNQRWYDYTGATPQQMEGWGWQSVHDPLVLPQVLERWKKLNRHRGAVRDGVSDARRRWRFPPLPHPRRAGSRWRRQIGPVVRRQHRYHRAAEQ